MLLMESFTTTVPAKRYDGLKRCGPQTQKNSDVRFMMDACTGTVVIGGDISRRSLFFLYLLCIGRTMVLRSTEAYIDQLRYQTARDPLLIIKKVDYPSVPF